MAKTKVLSTIRETVGERLFSTWEDSANRLYNHTMHDAKGSGLNGNGVSRERRSSFTANYIQSMYAAYVSGTLADNPGLGDMPEEASKLETTASSS